MEKTAMKKATKEDLLALVYGDEVYLRNGSFATKFDYVGRMPSSPDGYLIFSRGETLKHLYIGKDGTFRGEWFIGEYDNKFMINLRIEELEKELSDLKSELH